MGLYGLGSSSLTLIATPATMTIMGSGGNRFGRRWKSELLLVALFFVVSVG